MSDIAGTLSSIIQHQCQYCGMFHSGMCAKVKAIEYFPDGRVSRVEFHPPAPLGSLPAEIIKLQTTTTIPPQTT